MDQSTNDSQTDNNTPSSSSAQTKTPETNEDAEKKPLLSLAAILRLLAELSKSYAAVARIIVDYTFEGNGLTAECKKYINVSKRTSSQWAKPPKNSLKECVFC